jgi:hypothetical protein
MQSNYVLRLYDWKPLGVGLALAATPHISFENRRADERRPYTPLNRHGLALMPFGNKRKPHWCGGKA